MDWNQLKEEAKKMGYVEEPILENGIVWLTKKRLSFDLCFNNDGMVLLDGDEEIDMSVAVGELWNNTDLKEVLAPVPSYDKVKEMSQKIERLEFDNEALEMVHNELVQKIHIINEQNTKQYNELCEEIKKNNILEKRLEVSEKEHYRTLEQLRIATGALRDMPEMSRAQRALREMEGVK